MLICAGGTGGHLFPAEALAHELKKRGYRVFLAADSRIRKFAGHFPAEDIFTVESATFGSKNPLAVAKSLWKLYSGYRESRKLLSRVRPVCVVGFGGYPTVPPLLAASRAGIPTVIHDANAVLGRANRFLSRFADRIAIGFENTKGAGKFGYVVTGNPIRPALLKLAGQPYPARKPDQRFHLLVFGGSQGARFFSEVVPPALALLPESQRGLIRLVQQARPEDQGILKEQLDKLGLEAEVAPFFEDMADRLSAAHLVISRAGASTVSELSVMGRPSILVPYPHALGHDQAANAGKLAEVGGAKLIKQASLTPQKLAGEIADAMNDPKMLATAAKNAKKTGTPNAVNHLTDMIVELIQQKN